MKNYKKRTMPYVKTVKHDAKTLRQSTIAYIAFLILVILTLEL